MISDTDSEDGSNEEHLLRDCVAAQMESMSLKGLKGGDFKFVLPQEAPVFEPTPEEFKDPLKYINSIRHIAELSGICKIKPPKDFQPPFLLDVDNFKFNPRVQRINELEAKTRVKLDFFDLIGKFWRLQGTTILVPVLENRALDLYTLHVLVNSEGGWNSVTRQNKWDDIALNMGYRNTTDVGELLKTHYERLLYPYDIFRNGESLLWLREQDAHNFVEEEKHRQCKTKGQGHLKRGRPRKTDSIRETNETDDDEEEDEDEEVDPLAKYICRICNQGDVEDYMLLCDGCDDSYHTFCLIPPLNGIPSGDWRCPQCIIRDLDKPGEAFGFDQALRTYTLQQFGDMADQFKSDYFNTPGHMVPLSEVEKEFWRIVSSIEEDVTVEYGADLHAMDHGSGFPTNMCKPPLYPVDQVYADSKWNLNNLPVLDGSVLRYIKTDISGMKIPWMYVGMCFSTFCWHNEDHWSYSVNYLHWGEPKTWYGVAGSNSEKFEECMKKVAPELFQSQPDLLHQLVTIMNPNVFMNDGIMVWRTDQHAGEFVVTFPKAYHAGFNQGYNFAEAVNFALSDWLKIGRECVNQYSLLRRFCVFSHDELVCNISLDWSNLNPALVCALYDDMQKMIIQEVSLRQELSQWGVTKSTEELFELLLDDERLCEQCKTTCFLSAVTCECDQRKLACLRHFKDLCTCPPRKHILKYRYTIETLKKMWDKVMIRKQCYDSWSSSVKAALRVLKSKRTLDGLKSLVREAEDNKLCNTDEYEELCTVVKDAEECVNLAQILCYNSIQRSIMRFGPIVKKQKLKLTIEELQLFQEKIESLPCTIHEGRFVNELVHNVMSFTLLSSSLLKDDAPKSRDLRHCIEMGKDIDIYLPKINTLKHLYNLTQWLEDVRYRQEHPDQLTVEELRSLLNAGAQLPPHPAVEKTLGELQTLVTQLERWEEKVKLNLQAKYLIRITGIEGILLEAEDIKAFLPSLHIMKDAYRRGKEWVSQVEAVKSSNSHPYIDTLERLVNSAREIPVRLDQLPQLELHLSSAKSWKNKTCRTFLRKNSQYTLMDALVPRDTFGMDALKTKKRRRKEELDSKTVGGISLQGHVDSKVVVQAFKEAAKQEVVAMSLLRFRNKQKIKNDKSDKRYCLCRKVISGSMLQCVLCKDLFHALCVPTPKMTGSKGTQLTGQQVLSARELKYICPCCLRSRRPRLETIIPLLIALRKIPVRIPEGEALECLTERAMSWQDNARTTLATEELTSALAKLSVISQRIIEAEAREKTQKIISCELKKVGNIPGLNLTVHDISSTGVIPSEGATDYRCGVVQFFQQSQSRSISLQTVKEPDGALHRKPDSEKTGFITYESKKSQSSVENAVMASTMPSIEAPIMMISDKTRAALEDIMMEGDLLEVSLDETYHIWRILQATRPDTIEDSLTYRPYDPNFPERRTSKEKPKFKRRSLDAFQLSSKVKKIRVKVSQHRKVSRNGGDSAGGYARRPVSGGPLAEKNPSSEDNSGEYEGNTDEECAVAVCLKPNDPAVDWVQCDGGCDKWFHLVCVGLTMDDINESEDYLCTQCVNKAREGSSH